MSQQLADFLRRIPQSNQSAAKIEKLAQGLDMTMLQGYIALLQTIGVIKTDKHNCIQATSQTAKYMLESLAAFVESGHQLIDDWHTRGVYPNSNHNPLQNASTLLHAMEVRRLTLSNNPSPSRYESVAQVLIKRNNPQTGLPELLLQYDANAQHYQFIGGRHKETDGDLVTTMRREIDEELANHLIYQQDYQLKAIAENLVLRPSLSPTFGALTQYAFWIYHMVDLKQDLILQPDDRWVPVEQILAGYVADADGTRIEFMRTEIYEVINQRIAGGLENLDSSFRI